jgi:hypothetical protein
MNYDDNCGLVMEEVRIETPDDLEAILRMVRAALADGVISQDQHWPEGQLHVNQLPIGTLGDNGTWPDYFEYYFRCMSDGRRYRLSVETYHGSGGSWMPWPVE